jgi:hypothetical protein
MKFLLLLPLVFMHEHSTAELIKLSCQMLHDKNQYHSYTIDTDRKLVETDAASSVSAHITDSIISFTHNNNKSGAIWSHTIYRHNGSMTIMDLNNNNNTIIKLQCERFVRNKF